MANITITDNVGLTADLQIRDDSPLAKAKLTKIISTITSLVGNINKPIDQCDVKGATFGTTLGAPSVLVANAANLTIKGSASGALLVIKAADKTVFSDDGFSPPIPIASNECWVALEFDTSLDTKLAATADGFGVGIGGTTALSLSTYSLLTSSGGSFPSLKECLRQALENYSVTFAVDSVFAQPNGTINVTDVSGTIKFSGSYSVPISVSSLASADLPFNYKIKVNPGATLKVTGEIAITGDFIVRSHKVSNTVLHIGVYKKKGTSLTVSLTAGAGIAADVGQTDLIAAFFGVVLPGIDPKAAGITGANADSLRSVLKDSIDKNLAISMNASVSAIRTDEAAVLYSIDLAGGDPIQTKAAISSALRGDWTALGKLPNATSLRNIVQDTEESKHAIRINLLGIYNASTVVDYVKSCTILRDEYGQITIVDKSKASEVTVASTPYLADADRLRSALAEAFLATVTYVAGTFGPSSRLKADFAVSQTYFRYDNKMTRQELNDEILLGYLLGLISPGAWDGVLAANTTFGHVRIAANATYDDSSAMKLFFSDVNGRVPRAREEFELIGRRTMASLIDPSDPAGSVRLSVLSNDTIWNAMDDAGNVASFPSIPYLSHLGTTDVGVIGVDWVDINWWADAMVQVAPRLSDLLSAVAHSTAADPTTDNDFMEKRDLLARTLGAVARNSRAAFAAGWGIAVMVRLSGGANSVAMDISWGSTTQHYERTNS